MGIKTHVLLHLTTHENILDCFSECIHHRTKICSHEHCALEKEGRKQRKCSLVPCNYAITSWNNHIVLLFGFVVQSKESDK